MCGIVAVLGQPAGSAPRPEEVLAGLRRALAALGEKGPQTPPPSGRDGAAWIATLGAAATALDEVDAGLRAQAAVRTLVEREELCREIEERVGAVDDRLEELETALDRGEMVVGGGDLERLNASLIHAKDAAWSIGHDRLGLARRVRALCAGGAQAPDLIDALANSERVLQALDRLEVRGRDSAGIHFMIGVDGLARDGELGRRSADPLFGSGALRLLEGGRASLVYKAAAEIGELGDNGRRLRRALSDDPVLRDALRRAGGDVVVLGHTRWASVGIISEANAHPLNQEEEGSDGLPYVIAALNGDVDNYVELREAEGLRIADAITTDAKIIPMLVARRLSRGLSLEEAFRQTVASFRGSVAITAQSANDPDLLLLALCGSGQALYVGLAAGMFVVASEPYGLVEQTSTYLRLDGETPGNPANPTASRGQVVVLDRRRAGMLEGIRRIAYDGTELPVRAEELLRAEVTTRDIHRGDFPHYLLKEISQAPESFRKTLRGKIRQEAAGRLRVHLGEQALPAALCERLRTGAIRRLVVIGQGTAAVAGQAVADAIGHLVAEDRLTVSAMPATELSGFHLRPDMSDTLIVAISQSGTTTDTNRTVDLARGRGATVVAVVNRRGSDLVSKSDGVLFTSDGRDIEMSVASTKAFYSQVAAGFLLAAALRQAITGDGVDAEATRLLAALRELPAALETVLAGRAAIAAVAARLAPKRRYWAVVGNGPNRVAAAEIRIKLSELCYKSIACDATEDKKHIDLSAEPLIIVCAAALSGSTLADVAKEVAIYRAHKAMPIVIATRGATGFEGVEAVLEVPPCHPRLAFVLATMVGHLFGYEAAIAIDRLALPMREIRAEIERLAARALSGPGSPPPPHHPAIPGPGENLLETLRPRVEASIGRFLQGLAAGSYDGQLEASTAVRLTSLLRYVGGTTPLESYGAEHGRPGTPSAVIEDLMLALTRAIDELTRPVDAIKHQAKTVTVGISRTDEALLVVPLVKAALESGVPRDLLTYRDLRALAGLDAAVEAVRGFTRYRITEGKQGEPGWIEVEARGGIAREIPSRTSDNPELRGTKHQVARERQLFVARGRSDGRTVILVPEIDKSAVVGLLLLHVRFRDFASPAAMRGVLDAYRQRYTTLRDAVMETEPEFDETLLGRVPVTDLLTRPIHDLATYWQTREKIRSSGEVLR